MFVENTIHFELIIIKKWSVTFFPLHLFAHYGKFISTCLIICKFSS